MERAVGTIASLCSQSPLWKSQNPGFGERKGCHHHSLLSALDGWGGLKCPRSPDFGRKGEGVWPYKLRNTSEFRLDWLLQLGGMDWTLPSHEWDKGGQAPWQTALHSQDW